MVGNPGIARVPALGRHPNALVRGDQDAVTEYDALISDLYTSTLDLRIAGSQPVRVANPGVDTRVLGHQPPDHQRRVRGSVLTGREGRLTRSPWAGVATAPDGYPGPFPPTSPHGRNWT
jgi:hypothetical protein